MRTDVGHTNAIFGDLGRLTRAFKLLPFAHDGPCAYGPAVYLSQTTALLLQLNPRLFKTPFVNRSHALTCSASHWLTMAAAVAEWTKVIDDADDETARLILSLQLEDIREIQDHHSDTHATDEQNAISSYKAELELHQALRNIELDEENPASAPTSTPTVPTFECVVCTERYDVDHAWQAPCSHWYCDRDPQDLFRRSMTDQTLFSPRCCRQDIPFDDVQPFLGPQLSDEFEGRREELTAAKDNTGTYCYVATCSAFIKDSDKEDTAGTCQSCGQQTCIPCKHEAHEGDCPQDEALRQTRQLAQQQGWQQCPDCQRTVELNIGCNHMT